MREDGEELKEFLESHFPQANLTILPQLGVIVILPEPGEKEADPAFVKVVQAVATAWLQEKRNGPK
jgi:hypothetical protein